MAQAAIVRRNSSPLVAWCTLLVIGSVALGSLLPLTFDRGPWGLDQCLGWSLFAWGGSSVSDVVTNLCVYVPVGAMLFGSLGGRGRRPVTRVLVAGAGGAVLSAGLEWAQTMMSIRVASWEDVLMNVCGTLAGASLAAIVVAPPIHRRALRMIRETPLSTAAKGLTLGVMIYHLLPFDVVTSSTALWDSLRASRISWSGHVRPAGEWLTWAGYAGQFAVLGLLFAAADRERNRSIRESPAGAFVHVAVVALLLEVLQVFTVSHALDVMDGLAGVVGGLLGAVVGTWGMRGETVFTKASRVRGLLAMVLVGQVAYLLATHAEPFDLSWGHADLSRWNGIPFWTYFVRPFGAAVVALAGIVVAYGFLAGGVWVLLACASRIVRMLGVVGTVGTVAAACEALQMLTASRHPDVTDPVIALCVAAAVAMIEPARCCPERVAAGGGPTKEECRGRLGSGPE